MVQELVQADAAPDVIWRELDIRGKHLREIRRPADPCRSYLTGRIHQLVLESQLPHEIVNLVFK